MEKARSRLRKTPTPADSLIVKGPIVTTDRVKHHAQKKEFVVFQKYLKHLPLLIPAAASYAALWYLVTNFYPAQLADIPVTGSYLPIVVPFFVGTFFLCSYITLSTKRGALCALLLSVLFFLRLQRVIF